jgi:DNA-binding transcriptional LysR family regulator
VEVLVDNGLVDIVAAGLDAGVRSGDILARDMVAVPIGPDLRMVVVATPAFCGGRELPRHPRDLAAHPCIISPAHARRHLCLGFSRGGDALRMGGEAGHGQHPGAGRAGHARRSGLAFLPESVVAADIAAGRLVQVLDDWCEPYPGYHLYYQPRACLARAARGDRRPALAWRGSGDQA